MKIRIASDIHSCFWSYNKIPKLLDKYLPVTEDDSESTLVLAGDTGTFKDYPSTLKPILVHLSKRFKHIVVINGNHEFYGTVGIWEDPKGFWKGKKLPTNVHYLHNECMIIDDVVFVGSTLWTNFLNSDPVSMYTASKNMNDFRLIKTGYRRQEGTYINSCTSPLRPEETVVRHEESVEFIKDCLGIFEGLKKVVVSHHAPSFLSVADCYQGDTLNAAYASSLEELILDSDINLWVHGHTHVSFDYNIGETRVICNPFGYLQQEQNPRFNGNLIVEV